jgi:hypothetical protein
MPEYRAYMVGGDGHFTGFEVFNSGDDTEATDKAKRLVDGHDVELWSGARLVVILPHQDKDKHQDQDQDRDQLQDLELSNEVRALNRQIGESQHMSRNAGGAAATERMDKLTSDLEQERDDQQKLDDAK